MNKSIRLLLIFLGIPILAFIAYYSFFTVVERRQAALKQSITGAIRRYNVGYSSHIDFSTATDFDWDTLYMFTPFNSSHASINSTLGYWWWGYYTSGIQSLDNATLLVFVNNGRVVRWADFFPWEGNFVGVLDHQPFTPQTAIFYAQPEGSRTIRLLNPPKP